MRYRDIHTQLVSEMPQGILVQDPTTGTTLEVQEDQKALQARAAMFLRKEAKFYNMGRTAC